MDVVCEKYGWTLHYVLWGISYTNLLMMLNDSIVTEYLSKDVKRSEKRINGSDPKNKELIKRELFG